MYDAKMDSFKIYAKNGQNSQAERNKATIEVDHDL